MDDDDFEVFFQSMTVKDLKEIIKEYKTVKGLAKYRKADLIEAFINLFTEEEQEAAYKKWMPKKIQENIDRSINFLTTWRNTEFHLDEEEDVYSVEISWPGGEQDRCTVTLNEGNVEYECSCRLGEKGGICVHLIGIVVLLYIKDKIDIENFPFLIEEPWLDNILSLKDEILNNTADTDDADIDLDDYWLFIRGDKITAKWSGDYAGIKTVDINEINDTAKKPTTIEEWVVKKVVDKQLEYLRRNGRVRDIVTDKFGVIEKILKNPKQFKRLQGAFQRAAQKFGQDTYPQTPDEIREALRIGLIE